MGKMMRACSHLTTGKDHPETILHVFDGNRHRAYRFALLYADYTPGYADTLSAALREGDIAGVIRASHGIRGSAAIVGANRLRLLAESMESIAQTGDIERIRAAFPSLLVELEQSCQLFREYADSLFDCNELTEMNAMKKQ